MSLNSLRRLLAHPTLSIQLCLLGIVGGISAAALIITFRLSYEGLQSLFVDSTDHFAQLEGWSRLIIPIVSGLLIAAFALTTGLKYYRMGIPFVIHRLKANYGQIPFRTSLNQFFCGVLALSSGFVVGREGPSVHLGAAGSSFLGQWLKLPYNSIRILAGCGVAAGISASFNTPFAAVIFVMEVVLREYKIHIFIPVMLAAACGSILTQLVFGADNELSFLYFISLENWMYLYLIPFGIILGILATVFNRSLMKIIHWSKPISMTKRLLLAGVITGTVSFFIPQAMGAGLSPLDTLIADHLDIDLIFIVLAAKIILALCALGLGIPGGIIGAVFCIGILTGSLLLAPLTVMDDSLIKYSDSFALLGMAGLLTSVAHAPLAALSAVMELAHAPDVIAPAMIIIVSAYITSTQLLKNRSIFIMQLQYQGLGFAFSPIHDSMQKVGVLSVLTTDYVLINEHSERDSHRELNDDPSLLFMVQNEESGGARSYTLAQLDKRNHDAPLRQLSMQGLSSQTTMAEVFDALKEKREGAVYIYEESSDNIIGLISWDMLQNQLFKEDQNAH
jgi:H+/Cl- antiporter ClcA